MFAREGDGFGCFFGSALRVRFCGFWVGFGLGGARFVFDQFLAGGVRFEGWFGGVGGLVGFWRVEGAGWLILVAGFDFGVVFFQFGFLDQAFLDLLSCEEEGG